MPRQITLIDAALILTVAGRARNPFITYMNTADPSARVFYDTLHVYPSRDLVDPAIFIDNDQTPFL